jgi:protein TonB
LDGDDINESMKEIMIMLVALPIGLFGQKTVKVIQEDRVSLDKEIFYTLESDPSVRHGAYQLMNDNGAVILEGGYRNGLKVGIWTVYDTWKKYIVTQGAYAMDKPYGVWDFYNSDGKVEQKYDYTKKEIVYYMEDEKERKRPYKVIHGTDTIESVLDRPPLYFGGSRAMHHSMAVLQYPNVAFDKEITGKVVVSFTIDNAGKTSGHRITRGLHPEFDSEALRVVKSLPDNWFPGLLHGETVNVEYSYAILFTLR